MKKIILSFVFAMLSTSIAWATVIQSFDLPTQNSNNNVTPWDVLGDKNDNGTNSSPSIMALVRLREQETHTHIMFKPGGTAFGACVTSSTSAMLFGNWSDIIPTNGISGKFDLTGLLVTSADTTDYYEVEISYSNNNTITTEVPMLLTSGIMMDRFPFTIKSNLITENSVVRARIRALTAGVHAIQIRLMFCAH